MTKNADGISWHSIKRLVETDQQSCQTIVTQTLDNDLDQYKHTKTQLRHFCEERGKQWSDEYIDLLTRKVPMFYTLIKSYDSLNHALILSLEQCIDNIKDEMIPQNEYDHMMKL